MKKILILACICWMGLIIYNSSNIGQVSHSRSKALVKVIYNEKEINEESNIYKLNKGDYIIRKSAHFFEYFILSLIISNILFKFNLKEKETLVYILFICLFFGVIDEFYQSFVPNRTSSVSDILIDFSGSVVGTLIYYRKEKKKYSSLT